MDSGLSEPRPSQALHFFNAYLRRIKVSVCLTQYELQSLFVHLRGYESEKNGPMESLTVCVILLGSNRLMGRVFLILKG